MDRKTFNLKRFTLLSVMMCLSVLVFAGGKKEVTEKSVGAENSWTEMFDIKNRSGKYNAYAEAKDKAGNIAVAGPYNLIIDEESDLPVVNITNPAPGMKVPGSLNIVGTCFDDDKVEEVWLILDGDKENPVRVDGTEFWSYFLDTTNLLEGRHTITAYGVDDGNPNAYYNDEGVLDESKVKPKTGHSVSVDWHLNRYAPVTEITNIDMGAMVSGKITLVGQVTDGNGISSLEYSLDGGEHYNSVKLKETKLKAPDENGLTSYYTFSLPLDTKKMEEGPKLIWFKAIDGAGSVGVNSFLCFIDNASPELKIVTPELGESVNGIFTIAGYARDSNGLQNLKYKWGSLEGEFELTAGNPYWALELDSRVVKDNMTFSISTVDTMGNAVSTSRTFTNVNKGIKGNDVVYVDQSGDKPVIDIKYPMGEVDGEDGSLFIRGLAQDDDGVASIYYSVDGKPEIKLDTTGVFYQPIPGALSDGEHRITAYAVDKFGVKGEPQTVTFSSKGFAPVFAEDKYGDEDFYNGIEMNPESGKNYSVKISSSTGLKAIHYDWTWGTDGKISKDIACAEETSVPLTIALDGDDVPWGVSKLNISATDKFDRTSTHSVIFKISDFTGFYGTEPGVYFTDSTVAADGAISIDENKSVSGYFVGGKIASVTPSLRTVTARAEGNSITLSSNAGTDKFTVKVTTTSGAVYTSRQLYFPSTETAPDIRLTNDNSLVSGVFNNFNTRNTLSITGSITSNSTATVKYRILSAKVNYDANGTVVSSQVVPAVPLESATPITLRRGAFTLNLSADDFVDGVSIVEILATNASNKLSTTAVLVRKINEPISAELLDGDVSEPAAPAYYWLHGDGGETDYYGVCVYQGTTGLSFDHRPYSSLPDGDSTLDIKGTVIRVRKQGEGVKGRFATVDGSAYRSGMEILQTKNGTIENDPHSLVVKLSSSSPVETVTWTANEKPLPQGTIRNLGGNEYECEVPISGLPAGLVNIEATVNGGAKVSGTVSVLRRHAVVDNVETIYWTSAGGAVYDAANNRYILNNDAVLTGYANVPGTLSASLVRANNGLNVEVSGKEIKLSAKSDGTYTNISTRVMSDANGSWVSSAVALIADTSNPILKVTSIKPMDYIKDALVIAGSVTDGNGIAALEYKTVETEQTEGEESVWKSVSFDARGNFNETVSLADSPDGYMPVTIRATDNAGKTSYFNSAIRKDTTAPEVTIVVPEAGAKVNGETLFVFRVKDDSYVGTIQYVSPDGSLTKDFSLVASDSLSDSDANVSHEGETEDEESASEDLTGSIAELDAYSSVLTGSLPSTRLGQEGLPIDNTMKFVISDVAGNTTVIDKFGFEVTPETDLPVVEIHMPLEDSVMTTDFIISGVMYDDDGLKGANGNVLKTYYKVDDGDFMLLENENSQASFEINISPLSILTDNEHVITFYAEDINGVKGHEVARRFHISLEEPKGSVELPKIDGSVRGLITMSGWAKDKNGINKVQISVDNGASYNDAVVVPGPNREDPTQWTYELDTRVVQDGTHVVFLKIWDGYDITGLYTSLLNIDNTNPELNLELPLDDCFITNNLVISGQTTDNIELTELYMRILSLDGNEVPDYLRENDLYPDSIISQVIDVSELKDGLYNVEISGYDKAGNSKNVSRNIHVMKDADLTTVDLLYPLNGEYVNGEFNIYGTAKSVGEKIEYFDLYVDGVRIPGLTTTLTDSGYYTFRLMPEMVIDKKNFTEADLEKSAANAEARSRANEEGLAAVNARNAEKKAAIEAAKAAALEAGEEYTGPEYEEEVYEPLAADLYESGVFRLTPGVHSYKIVAHTNEENEIESREQTLNYSPYGPWVTLDNFMYGDYAVKRPILKGNAGYALTEEEKADLKNKKKLPTERQTELAGKSVKRVYLSFDNGRTYTPVSSVGKGAWKYRIEDQDVAEGFHFLLVKAEMNNGETAITRTIVQVDRTLPEVRLISPGAGGHYNQQLRFEGLSSDDVNLEDVTLYLRRGDRAAYEVPKFIQGLYFDANVWGATLWSAGVGLTAFDDAVKIQVSFGQFTQGQRDFVSKLFQRDMTNMRYGGPVVISGKVIAQVAYIPFNYFFGHDFDWLSATVSIGANFSYFSQSGASIAAGEKWSKTILTAALMQIEFPRMTFEDNQYFKTWAVYWEPSLWFIPSDVVSSKIQTLVPTFSVGFRTSLF